MPKRKYFIEGAQITFKNFSGKARNYNEAGKRNFVVLLSDDMAKQLAADGFKIKLMKAKEDGDPTPPYIQVNVSYAVAGPLVVLICGDKETELDEESVGSLDYAELLNVDLEFGPYKWTYNGTSGIKAYLNKMYVTVAPDPLSEKYRRPKPD